MNTRTVSRKLWRYWYYFRIGYATYLTFLLGAVNTLVVVWYLALANVPGIQNVFGSFSRFAVAAILVGVPLSIGVGFLHFKRTHAYKSEVDIAIESNPFNWKVVPGKEREVYIPFWKFQLDYFLRMGVFTDEEQKKMLEVRRNFEKLITDGTI